MAVTLNSVNPTLLPPTITGPIFAKATEESAVMQLARGPAVVNANTAIPISMDVPQVADWVAEGGVKPAAQVGVGVKIMTGKKIALIVPVSAGGRPHQPGRRARPAQAGSADAIARAFDYAAINGKSIRTGAAGPFADYLANWRPTRSRSAPPRRRPAACTPTSSPVPARSSTRTTTSPASPLTRGSRSTRCSRPTRRAGRCSSTRTQRRPTTSTAGRSPGSRRTSTRASPAGTGVQATRCSWSRSSAPRPVARSCCVGRQLGDASPTTQRRRPCRPRSRRGAASTPPSPSPVPPAARTRSRSRTSRRTSPQPRHRSPSTSVPHRRHRATSKATIAASGAGGTDSLLRGIGGDFSQAAYGVGMDITVQDLERGLVLRRHQLALGVPGEPRAAARRGVLRVRHGLARRAFVAYTKGTAPF
jgi:hypothetical protein